ncbi:protein amnionless isoform X2 [Daktulosphaira vitifoliae]|nr:protein amnionless isoform X2 [Daktulosphaira vitifoliae]
MPSSIDVAIFQEDTSVPVVLPSVGVDVCQMILPSNGELILEPNSAFTVSTSVSNEAFGNSGCTGQNISFKKKSPLLWADPDNWSSNSSSATPHIEKIPCEHDIVYFNPHNSFSTSVPNAQIHVGAIKFGNQTFSQKELNEFLTTDIGDQEIKSVSSNNEVSITLTIPICNDPTGCECGNQHLLDDVCQIVAKRCSKKLGCVNPIKPVGHCCLICGAYFLINYDPRLYNENTFFNVFNSSNKETLDKFKNYELNFHIKKIINGKLQLVIASNAKYVDEIDEIAHIFFKKLSSSYLKLGISDVKMFNSGPSYDIDGLTFGKMALYTCIIVLLCMLAIMFYYNGDWEVQIARFQSRGRVVHFVKFENDTVGVESIDENNERQRKTSFNNPTYGSIESTSYSQNVIDTLPDLPKSILPSKIDHMDVELVETSNYTK